MLPIRNGARVFRQLLAFQIQVRSFGRRSGANAFVEGPRDWSKKQKKRHAAASEMKQNRRFPHVERMKADSAAKRLDSKSMETYIEGLNVDLEGIMTRLMQPSPHSDVLGEVPPVPIQGSISFDECFSLYKRMKRLGPPSQRTDGGSSWNSNSRRDGASQEQEQGQGYEEGGVDVKGEMNKLAPFSSSLSSPSSNDGAFVDISSDMVNEALISWTRVQGSQRPFSKFAKQSAELLALAEMRGLDVSVEAYNSVMGALNHVSRHQNKGRYTIHQHSKQVVDLFGDMVKKGSDPSPASWEHLIGAYADLGQLGKAIEILEQLRSLRIPVNSGAYVSVLWKYVDNWQIDSADEFWLRMKEDGVELTLEAFRAMFGLCVKAKRPERALFMLDELAFHDLQPDKAIFTSVLRAIAAAPHWASGYEDIIFDVMSRFEGAELTPDAHVYGAIIFAFRCAGDADAAHFYYQECLSKGIVPTRGLYNSLLSAYARHQGVGVSPYGYSGRYSRPRRIIGADKDEAALLSIGSHQAADLLSRGMFSSIDTEKSTKGVRHKGQMKDAFDEHGSLKGSVATDEVHALADQEGSWRLDELRRREEEAFQARKAPSYPGYYKPPVLELDGEMEAVEEEEEEIGEVEEGASVARLSDFHNSSQLRQQLEEAGISVADDGSFDLDSALDKLNLWGDEEENEADYDGYEEDEEGEEEQEDERWGEDRDRNQSQSQSQGRDGGNWSASELASLLDGHDLPDALRSLTFPPEVDEVQNMWRLVEFGRAGDPDYTAPLLTRWANNKERAESALQSMVHSGIAPDIVTMNNLLDVYAEAKDEPGAMQVFTEEFSKRDVVANDHTYAILVRMHVRRKNDDAALAVLTEAVSKDLAVSGESFGLVINSLVKRSKIVEALKVLELNADLQERVRSLAGRGQIARVKIPEKYLKLVRSKCKALGVRHPNLPADPNMWIKDMRTSRIQAKHQPASPSSNKRVQGVRSALFSKAKA